MTDRMKGTPGRETSLGGKGHGFPSTMWGLVSRIRGSDTEEQRAGLEELCQRYWKPIYRYVRIAWAKSNEDAKDLTQAFLLWLMEGEPLRKYEEDREKLRTYLKVLLKGFVRDRQKALQRLKRGGNLKIIDLDAGNHALKEAISDPSAEGLRPILGDRGESARGWTGPRPPCRTGKINPVPGIRNIRSRQIERAPHLQNHRG